MKYQEAYSDYMNNLMNIESYRYKVIRTHNL